jgi:hypothetical protein
LLNIFAIHKPEEKMSRYILERSKIMFDEVNKYEQGLIERGEISNKLQKQPIDVYEEIPRGG